MVVEHFSKQKLRSAIHVMGPTLTALLFAGIGNGVAHAQGTMDFSGAQTLMSTFKLSSSSLTIRFSEFSESRTSEAVNEWMQMEDRPTAILCAYDQLVPALYQELQKHKMRIPQKMAVLGRGDLPLASYINPPLTTFRVPITEMGRIAANLLFDQIDGKELLKPQQQVLLECQLIQRAST